MTTAFKPSRTDGRSDRRVVFELIENSEPDTTVTYNEIIEALQDGLDSEVDRSRAQRAVSQANKTFLREKSRCLTVVKDVGYRVVRADEHVGLALNKKISAERKLACGVEIMRHVNLDELSESQRKSHLGSLMIMSGLHQMVKESANRHDKSEALIANLTQRVSALEGS